MMSFSPNRVTKVSFFLLVRFATFATRCWLQIRCRCVVLEAFREWKGTFYRGNDALERTCFFRREFSFLDIIVNLRWSIYHLLFDLNEEEFEESESGSYMCRPDRSLDETMNYCPRIDVYFTHIPRYLPKKWTIQLNVTNWCELSLSTNRNYQDPSPMGLVSSPNLLTPWASINAALSKRPLSRQIRSQKTSPYQFIQTGIQNPTDGLRDKPRPPRRIKHHN